MRGLRKDISDIISKAEYQILTLLSLQDCIVKAEAYDEEKALYESEKQLYKEARADAEKSKEKYDKLFNVLGVEEERHKTPEERELSSMEGDNSPYYKISRALTDKEEEEVLEILIEYLVHPDINGNVIKPKLKSGVEVVRR